MIEYKTDKRKSLPMEQAMELLQKGEFATLSMIEREGEVYGGYGTPINFAWDGGSYIYIHGSVEGHKIECIRANNRVSLSIVGSTHIVSNRFTTAYKSILVRGRAGILTDNQQCIIALEHILKKYTPDHIEHGLKYAQNYLNQTAIIRVEIGSISGKSST